MSDHCQHPQLGRAPSGGRTAFRICPDCSQVLINAKASLPADAKWEPTKVTLRKGDDLFIGLLRHAINTKAPAR